MTVEQMLFRCKGGNLAHSSRAVTIPERWDPHDWICESLLVHICSPFCAIWFRSNLPASPGGTSLSKLLSTKLSPEGKRSELYGYKQRYRTRFSSCNWQLLRWIWHSLLLLTQSSIIMNTKSHHYTVSLHYETQLSYPQIISLVHI